MTVEAYILFKVASGREREACQQIAKIKEVTTASVVYGEYDLIAKVIVPELPALEDFLAEKIRTVPSIILTSTMVIAQECKGKQKQTKK